MQRILEATLAAAVVLAAAGAAGAQDAKQAIAEAMAQVERGETGPAQDTLRQAMLALSNQAPLSVARTVLVDEATGYGQYKPRADNVYRPDEPIEVYIEPSGYAFQQDGELWRFGIRTDLLVLDKEGRILTGKENITEMAFEARQPVFELILNLTYSLSGLEPGEYVIRTTLHDVVDAESTSFEIPIEIAAP